MKFVKKIGRRALEALRRFSHFLVLCYISRQGLKTSILSESSNFLTVSNLIGTSLQSAEELLSTIGLREVIPSELSITLFVAIQVCSSFAPLAMLLPRLNMILLVILIILNWHIIFSVDRWLVPVGESPIVLSLVLLVLVWEYLNRKRTLAPQIALGVSPIHVYDKRALANFAEQLRQQF